MKTYHGERTQFGAVVLVRDEDGTERPLCPRFDLRNHSPDGFEWGYGGSGPAQLALALAADMLGDDERAQDVYQDLKWKLISGLRETRWEFTEEQLRDAIAALGRGNDPVPHWAVKPKDAGHAQLRQERHPPGREPNGGRGR